MLSFQMSQCGVIYAAIKWYVCTQKHIVCSVESMTLLDTFAVRWQYWKVSSCCLNHLHGHFYTHNTTALVLHSLSSTQSELFSSMVQVPRILNERMYKLKTQKLRAKECNLDRYQDAFREPFVKILTIINFSILQHILCLPHQLFQYLLKYITASVERVCSP